jgi:hypothetical protein
MARIVELGHHGRFAQQFEALAVEVEAVGDRPGVGDRHRLGDEGAALHRHARRRREVVADRPFRPVREVGEGCDDRRPAVDGQFCRHGHPPGAFPVPR